MKKQRRAQQLGTDSAKLLKDLASKLSATKPDAAQTVLKKGKGKGKSNNKDKEQVKDQKDQKDQKDKDKKKEEEKVHWMPTALASSTTPPPDPTCISLKTIFARQTDKTQIEFENENGAWKGKGVLDDDAAQAVASSSVMINAATTPRTPEGLPPPDEFSTPNIRPRFGFNSPMESMEVNRKLSSTFDFSKFPGWAKKVEASDEPMDSELSPTVAMPSPSPQPPPFEKHVQGESACPTGSPPVRPPLVASWSCFEDSAEKVAKPCVAAAAMAMESMEALVQPLEPETPQGPPDSHLPPGPGPWPKPGTEPRMVSSLDDAMSWASDFHDRAMEARGLDFGLCGFDQDVILDQHHSTIRRLLTK